MKKLFLLLSLVFSFTLTSCLDDAEDVLTATDTFIAFNKISDPNAASEAEFKAASYRMGIDYTNKTIEIQVNSVFEEDGESAILNFGKFPFKASANGGFALNAEQIVPTENGKPSTKYLITNFEGKMWIHFIQVNGKTVEKKIYEFSYFVNNRKVVVYNQEPTYYCPQTTVNDVNGRIPEFKTSETEFKLTYYPKTADVSIIRAQFAQGMPQLNIDLSEVPFTLTEDGLCIQAKEIIPTIADKPFPSMPVKDFVMNIQNNATAMTMSFKCDFKGTTFLVQSNGSIYPQKAEEK